MRSTEDADYDKIISHSLDAEQSAQGAAKSIKASLANAKGSREGAPARRSKSVETR
jgi:hypothetical protein